MHSVPTTERMFDMPAGEFKARIWRWANAQASGSTATLLGVLATHASMNDCRWAISMTTLMAKYEIALNKANPEYVTLMPEPRTVRRWLKPFKDAGIIEIEQRKGSKNHLGNVNPVWFSLNTYTFDFSHVLIKGELLDHDFMAPLPVEDPNLSDGMTDGMSARMSAITGIPTPSLTYSSTQRPPVKDTKALPSAAKPSRQPTAMEYFERHNPKAAAVADDRLPAAVTACIQNFGPEKTAVVLKGADRYWNSMAHDPEDLMDTLLGDLAHGGTYNGPALVRSTTHDEQGHALLVA